MVTPRWHELRRAAVTAYIDTENAFHWAHPEPTMQTATKSKRFRTLNELNRARWKEDVLNPRRRIQLMALGGAVFEVLTRWLTEQESAVDVRSYGKAGDPGARAVSAVLGDRSKGDLDVPGDWVHVAVGPDENLADLELVKDLADRSRRAEPQTFYVVSSDLGETLSWAASIAAEAPADHRYQVILGPTVLNPGLFFDNPPALAPLEYAGMLSELFWQAVSAQKNGPLSHVRLSRSAHDLSVSHLNQRLTDRALRVELSEARTEMAFVNRLVTRANDLDGLPGLSVTAKLTATAGWAPQILAAWRQRFPEAADRPVYARPEQVGPLVHRVAGHVALTRLTEAVRHALDASDGDGVAEARDRLDEAEEIRRNELGAARHEP